MSELKSHKYIFVAVMTGIPPIAWQAVMMSPLANQLLSPATIGTNLILSQAGLSQISTFVFPNVAADTLVSLLANQTLTNKTMDALNNSFFELYQSPIYMRTGGMEPNATTPFLDGALNAHTNGGTITSVWDTTEGLCTLFTNTAVSAAVAGIVSPTTGVGIARNAFYTSVKTRAKVSQITNGNYYFGFTSLNSTVGLASATPLGSADSGVIIGWRSTDTNFQIFSNDGTGAMVVTPVAGPIPKDTAFHTLNIMWPGGGGNVIVTIDTTSTTLTTRIPATTTNQFFSQVCSNSTTTATSPQIKGLFIESVK
jgi:hypothetical protein